MTSLTTINIGGSDVVLDALLTTDTTNPVANRFNIDSGNVYMAGNVDETVTLSTNVATSNPITLIYSEGVSR